MATICSWLLTSGPPHSYLWNFFSCKTCPGNQGSRRAVDPCFIPGHALHEKGLQRQIGDGTLVTNQERRAPARVPADKPVVNRGFCSSIGLNRVSFVRSSRVTPRRLSSIVWGVRGAVFSLANSPVGVLCCPSPPGPAVPPCAAPYRPARGTSGFWTRQDDKTTAALCSWLLTSGATFFFANLCQCKAFPGMEGRMPLPETAIYRVQNPGIQYWDYGVPEDHSSFIQDLFPHQIVKNQMVEKISCTFLSTYIKVVGFRLARRPNDFAAQPPNCSGQRSRMSLRKHKTYKISRKTV